MWEYVHEVLMQKQTTTHTTMRKHTLLEWHVAMTSEWKGLADRCHISPHLCRWVWDDIRWSSSPYSTTCTWRCSEGNRELSLQIHMRVFVCNDFVWVGMFNHVSVYMFVCNVCLCVSVWVLLCIRYEYVSVSVMNCACTSSYLKEKWVWFVLEKEFLSVTLARKVDMLHKVRGVCVCFWGLT